MKEVFQKITNSIGTITAILAVLSGFMTTVLKCTGVDLTATCQAEWLGPYAAAAGMTFGAIALFSKSLRPGGFLNSWFGSTAVVVPDTSKHSTAGTVTPQQVAQP